MSFFQLLTSLTVWEGAGLSIFFGWVVILARVAANDDKTRKTRRVGGEGVFRIENLTPERLRGSIDIPDNLCTHRYFDLAPNQEQSFSSSCETRFIIIKKINELDTFIQLPFNKRDGSHTTITGKWTPGAAYGGYILTQK